MSQVLNIVVVDDDEVDRMAVRRALLKSGLDVEVHEAANGERALSLLRQTPFDCALLDYHLPPGDGLAVLREARAAGIRTPVVMLTGQGNEERAVETMKAGAADYLAKCNLTPERLRSSILHAVRLNQAELEASEAEQALQRSEQRFRSLVEASTVVVWWRDPEGAIVRECPGWGNFTGQSFAAYRGWGWLEAIHPEDRDRVEQTWRAALGTKARYGCAYRLRRADGVYRHTVSRGIPLLRPDGLLDEWVGTNTDVTEEHLREEDTQRRLDFERQLVGIVSHDLRNPLAAISVSAGLLLRMPELGDRARKTAQRIASSTDRAHRMIADLLDFTRARLGTGIRVVRKPGDVHEVARRAVEEAQAAHPARTLAWIHEGDGEGEWDEPRLEQVLGNLLGNALKHGDPAGIVTMTSRGAGARVALEVHNAGRPIPAALMPSLFEPYRVGDTPDEAARLSLGLGLFIVQEIVTAHGGTVEVRSTQEDGTLFTVVLPRSPGPG